MFFWTLSSSVFILDFLSGSTGIPPNLKILPSGPQHVRTGKNLVLTCTAGVPDFELIENLRWRDPAGKLIPQDER